MSDRPQITVDQKSLAIGVLTVTACILFVGLMLVMQQPARAIGMNDRSGDYIMLTQQVSNSGEALIVIDAAAQKMMVYGFDYNTRQLEIVRRVDLNEMPKAQGRQGPAGG